MEPLEFGELPGEAVLLVDVDSSHSSNRASAVQAASALAINAAALVTHDRDFSRVSALRIIS
jgi:predicted nucleic acid-binding protein